MPLRYGSGPSYQSLKREVRSTIKLSVSESFHLSELLWEKLSHMPSTYSRRQELFSFYLAIRRRVSSGTPCIISIRGESQAPSVKRKSRKSKNSTSDTSLRQEQSETS